MVLAVTGVANGDLVKEWAGVLIAVAFGIISTAIYVSQLIYASQLKKSAQREEYRREQELLEARHKREMAELNGHPGVSA